MFGPVAGASVNLKPELKHISERQNTVKEIKYVYINMNAIQEEQTTSPEPEAPPESDDEAKLEILVFEPPPGLEEPTKKKTRQMSREYMREYYHKNKTDIACSFCFKTYVQEQSC